MKLVPTNRRELLWLIFRPAALLAVCAVLGGWMISMPGRSFGGAPPPFSIAEQEMANRLKADVELLADSIGERNMNRYQQLRQTAALLTKRFQSLGYTVYEEPYSVHNRQVTNVIAELAGASAPEEIVLIGAHYDSPPESPGANDNGSGVAALLELARRFKGAKPARTLRFVAFVNEEPPWFQTDLMGSRVHAANARKRGDRIVAMLALETIGYYSDAAGSQQYPPPFNLFYPDTGNFIAFVGDTGSRELVHQSIRIFRDSASFPSEGIAAPAAVKGIGWSDHWSFRQEGYPGIMVTDTAPFRYPHYHEATDTPDKIDYERMARVVGGIAKVVEGLSRQQASR